MILLILASNEDMHKSLSGLEFRPDPTTDYGVSCPEASKNRSRHFFLVAINPIHFKFVGNEDMRNILDELEFRPVIRSYLPLTFFKNPPYRLIMEK